MSLPQKLLWILPTLAFFATIGAAGWAISHPHEELPEVLALGTWSLKDPDGRSYGSDEMKGHVCVVDFIFTYCSGPCPVVTSGMRDVQDALAGERDVRFVTISVDPTRDKPEVLKAFATKWGADPSRWTYVTGEQVYNYVYDNFKLMARPVDGPPGENILHSSQLLLVDRNGTLRGLYTYAKHGMFGAWDGDRSVTDQLAADARRLARTPEKLMSIRSLPRLNAVLNGTCAILLCFGLFFVKKKAIALHKSCMLAALLVSVAFLGSYLTYHAMVGSVKFALQGWIRPVYFGVLLSHTILAVVIVPMALATVWLGWRDRIDKHKNLARWTLPLWLYVSLTGILVFVMLYQF